jgi:hypothetical protein
MINPNSKVGRGNLADNFDIAKRQLHSGSHFGQGLLRVLDLDETRQHQLPSASPQHRYELKVAWLSSATGHVRLGRADDQEMLAHNRRVRSAHRNERSESPYPRQCSFLFVWTAQVYGGLEFRPAGKGYSFVSNPLRGIWFVAADNARIKKRIFANAATAAGSDRSRVQSSICAKRSDGFVGFAIPKPLDWP